MDSDCDIAADAVEKAVQIFFLSDTTIGAVIGHAGVRGVDKSGIFVRIQDVWFDGQYRLLKGMETFYYSLTCCYGDAIKRFIIHTWSHDRFLGIENLEYVDNKKYNLE
jgi:hyaluronan synthase